MPSLILSVLPSLVPTTQPSGEQPTIVPTGLPTQLPVHVPTLFPSVIPSVLPAVATLTPSWMPTVRPSVQLTEFPSVIPSMVSLAPEAERTEHPSLLPSCVPLSMPTLTPSLEPTIVPSVGSSVQSSLNPTCTPSVHITSVPTALPSASRTLIPSVHPTEITNTLTPSMLPSVVPSDSSPTQSLVPSSMPVMSVSPSFNPSFYPSALLSSVPSTRPSQYPISEMPVAVSTAPSVVATVIPSEIPSSAPVDVPTTFPTSSEAWKGTLPSNNSISVLGQSEFDFKFMLPFLSLSSGPMGSAFSNIQLSVDPETTATVVDGRLMTSFSSDSRISFSSSGGWDTNRRSAAKLKDINDDGFDDLIIGDPYNSRCYVLFGAEDGLRDMHHGFTIFGESEGDLMGWSVSGAGDVNNDTINDIIIGAPAVKSMGAFYVIYGRQSFNSDIYLNNLTSHLGFVILSARKSDYLGISVSSAGDVNGDDCADVVVGGAMTSQYFSGATVVLFGCRTKSSTSMSIFSDLQGFVIYGSTFSFCGYSTSAAGDVNNDGLGDIAIGCSPQRSTLNPASYIVYGSRALPQEMELTSMTTAEGVTITGEGEIVQWMGDINGDHYDDVLISSCESISMGCILYSNTSHMTRRSALVSVSPTSVPLMPPSRRPVTTRNPSCVPSFHPTAPTLEPTASQSVPSLVPTERPTGPTFVPSERPTEDPTVLPSEMPSEIPSVLPSEIHSTVPIARPTFDPTFQSTIRPSARPSTVVTSIKSRTPFSIPTATPSLLSIPGTYALHYVGQRMDLKNETVGFQNYIVNTSEDVSIRNTNGHNKYSIFPNPRSELTIQYFNNSNDVIDLTAFTTVTNVGDLVITEGSVIITFGTQQSIHILNLHTVDVSKRNFVFYQKDSPESIDESGTFSIVAACLIALGGVTLGTLMILRLYKSALVVKPQLTIDKDHFLMEVTYSQDGKLLSKNGSPVEKESDIDSGELDAFSVTNSTNLSEHTINSDGVWENKFEVYNLQSIPHPQQIDSCDGIDVSNVNHNFTLTNDFQGSVEGHDVWWTNYENQVYCYDDMSTNNLDAGLLEEWQGHEYHPPYDYQLIVERLISKDHNLETVGV